MSTTRPWPCILSLCEYWEDPCSIVQRSRPGESFHEVCGLLRTTETILRKLKHHFRIYTRVSRCYQCPGMRLHVALNRRCKTFWVSYLCHVFTSFNIFIFFQRFLLVHCQVTIIFVVSICLFVCLFVCAEFFQPSSIRFGSN